MNCDFTEKISLLIDGELSEHEAREVQRHLSGCGGCQAARADFLGFRSEISNYGASLNPAAQAEALKRILGQSTDRPRVAPKLGWSWSFAPRAVAFASLILVAALIGFIVYRAAQNNESSIAQKNPAPVPSPTAQIASATPEATPLASPEPSQTPGAPGAKPSDKNPSKPKSVRRYPVLPNDGNNIASVQPNSDAAQPSTSANNAGDIQALTAMHFEKSELLLRAFRNVRSSKPGRPVDVDYERKLARQLIVRNMMLKREADTAGEIQVGSLLENLEPILLDIANLPAGAGAEDVRVINDRVERKNIVALLQVNSTVLARARDDD
jgi:hypothetical protein